MYNGSWNFGPSVHETMKVKDIVRLFFKYLNFKKKLVIKGKFKETHLLKLNSSKALNILKWKNKWNMKKSILKTAKWYEYYLNKKDIKKITLIQIEEYFKKMIEGVTITELSKIEDHRGTIFPMLRARC